MASAHIVWLSTRHEKKNKRRPNSANRSAPLRARTSMNRPFVVSALSTLCREESPPCRVRTPGTQPQRCPTRTPSRRRSAGPSNPACRRGCVRHADSPASVCHWSRSLSCPPRPAHLPATGPHPRSTALPIDRHHRITSILSCWCSRWIAIRSCSFSADGISPAWLRAAKAANMRNRAPNVGYVCIVSERVVFRV